MGMRAHTFHGLSEGMYKYWLGHAGVRHGVEQDPKTVNAVRDIDVAPELANAVKRYIAGQDFKKSTYLFQTPRGEPLSQRNVLRDTLRPILKRMSREKFGFHIFRRFRASWLRKNRVRWDLEKIWIGHAHKGLTDQYAEQLREDVKYHRKWCEKKDWRWSTHQCFATFATKTRCDRLKESSMKLLNLRG